MFIRKRHYQFALMFLLLGLLTFSLSLSAQDDISIISASPANVLIKGPVQAINVNIVTIANLDVILDLDDPVLENLIIGDVISIEGNIFQVGAESTVIIIPVVVTRLDVEIIVPIITLQGPVENINGTIVTVYGIDMQLAAGGPLLNDLQIGDTIIVNGNVFPTGQTFVVIVVIIIIDGDNPEATPEATAEITPEATAEATPEVTPEVTEEPEGDDDDSVIIVIEGPVTNININIITIYNIDIEVNIDDPILTVIQIGDVIRVEGEIVGSGTTLVIIAITIIYIDVDVVVNPDGEVWRGDNCQNPPPPWAPANGWRRKCEGGGNNNSQGNGNNGRGNGNGKGRNKGNDDD